jgi:uncharacterized RDD family membrane protein YckC
MTFEAPGAGTAPAGGASGPRANFGRRFVAWLVDTILLGIVFGVVYVLIDPVTANLLSLVGGLAYYGYFEGSASGQTVGKKALGIRVIDFRAGGPIGFGRGLLRYIGKVISSIPCFLGFLWMLWDREKQTWHDKIATTVVVPESAYPVEKWP